jgi:2-methylcitrate dehydratase PrpD
MSGEHLKTWEQHDAITRRLVDFASQARYDALSAETVSECKRRLIDTFASALGACDTPLAEMARKVAGRTRGDTQARVWGITLRRRRKRQRSRTA